MLGISVGLEWIARVESVDGRLGMPGWLVLALSYGQMDGLVEEWHAESSALRLI